MAITLREKITNALDRREAKRLNARRRKVDETDVRRAVAWARTHFNVGGPDTMLDPPTFDMEINGNEITVWPKLYGRRIAAKLGITYQLCREGNQLCWKGANPLTGSLITLRVGVQSPQVDSS